MWEHAYAHLTFMRSADLCSLAQNPQTCTEKSDATLKSLVWPRAHDSASGSASHSVRSGGVEDAPFPSSTQSAASQSDYQATNAILASTDSEKADAGPLLPTADHGQSEGPHKG